MIVVVKLKSGREIVVLKAHSEEDARKVKEDVERWISTDVVISFATHSGLEEVAASEIEAVSLRRLDSTGRLKARVSSGRRSSLHA